jgi:hypothetical protein
MPPGAKLSSIEALEVLRVALAVYVPKAGSILDDAGQDIVRTRIWLETDRVLHWQQQIRLRTAALAQAEQELLTARLSRHPAAVQERRNAVERARRSLREAEEKLQRVRRWLARYPTDVEAHAAVVRRLQHVLTYDLGKALAFLEGAAGILADYAGLTPTAPVTNPVSATLATDAVPPPPGPLHEPVDCPRSRDREGAVPGHATSTVVGPPAHARGSACQFTAPMRATPFGNMPPPEPPASRHIVPERSKRQQAASPDVNEEGGGE